MNNIMNDWGYLIAYLSPIAGPLLIIVGIISLFLPHVNWTLRLLFLGSGIGYLYMGRKYNKNG